MYIRVFIFCVIFSIHAFGQVENGAKTIAVNGTNLFVDIGGSGEPLLIIHGGPGLGYKYFLPHLLPLEKEFQVIFYDQRACGLSAVPAPDSILMHFLIEDIEAMRKKFNIGRLNILAHSWGAVLAARYALKYPDRVKKLILSNPAPFNREYDAASETLMEQRTTPQDSIDRATIMTNEKLTVADYEALFLIAFRTSAFNKDALDALHLGLPENFVDANTALYAGLSTDPSLGMNLYASLSAFTFPVLIIHGERDLIPRASIDRLRQGIPNATLEIFHRSGHFPFVEEPELYQKTVSAFLTTN